METNDKLVALCADCQRCESTHKTEIFSDNLCGRMWMCVCAIRFGQRNVRHKRL